MRRKVKKSEKPAAKWGPMKQSEVAIKRRILKKWETGGRTLNRKHLRVPKRQQRTTRNRGQLWISAYRVRVRDYDPHLTPLFGLLRRVRPGSGKFDGVRRVAARPEGTTPRLLNPNELAKWASLVLLTSSAAFVTAVGVIFKWVQYYFVLWLFISFNSAPTHALLSKFSRYFLLLGFNLPSVAPSEASLGV